MLVGYVDGNLAGKWQGGNGVVVEELMNDEC